MRYRPGDRVRVASRTSAGHHRTPGYVKGKTGWIERVHASFPNPETRAYGRDGLPSQPLYLVSFAQGDIWPAYRGGREGDRVCVDLFEQWLEDAE